MQGQLRIWRGFISGLIIHLRADQEVESPIVFAEYCTILCMISVIHAPIIQFIWSENSCTMVLLVSERPVRKDTYIYSFLVSYIRPLAVDSTAFVACSDCRRGEEQFRSHLGPTIAAFLHVINGHLYPHNNSSPVVQ